MENLDHRAAIQDIVEPLLAGTLSPETAAAAATGGKQPKTAAQKAMRKTFKGTAHLAKLLPTGSVLAFQILSPALTHQGQCRSAVSRATTAALLAGCAASCFLLSFTDSLRDGRGKVRYGLATPRGLWVIDGAAVEVTAEEVAGFRLRAIDFLHALASFLVFVAVAAFDRNVARCFWPEPTAEVKELLVALPVGVGVVCSLFFIAFPSRRHGIGFPLSRN